MKNTVNKRNITIYNSLLCLEYILQNNYFTLEDLSGSIYFGNLQPETILKYIRTFKQAGIEFKRINNKIYKIEKLPFNINLDEEDKNIFFKILEIYKTYLNKNEIIDENKFLNNINLLLSEKLQTKGKETKINTNKTDNEQKLFLLKKYCNDKQRLEITYSDNNQNFIDMVEPNTIMTAENQIYLKVYNITQKHLSLIDTSKIINISQTPVKNKFGFDKQEVILKITSPLVNKYILKEGEKLISKNKQELIIKSFYYDKIIFFKNILRYMDTCEIVAPKPLHKEFREYVANIMKLYNCKN